MADTVASGGDILTKKIGPLPAVVWVGAIGLGLYLGYFKKKSSTNPTIPLAVGTDSGVGAGAGGWNYQPPAAVVTATYATNEQWGQAAISYLIGQNYSASLADSAIRNYLGGLQVSIQQQPLVDAAIRGIGPTPQILNPVTGPDPTTPITPPAPAGGGGGTNTPPPAPPGGGLFGLLFGLVNDFFGNISGSISGVHVPVNGQDYQVSGSYGDNAGTVTVTNPDGSLVTVNANPLTTTNSNATTTPVGTITGTRTYVVATGDTLSSISIKMYGSALQQDKIYNANLSAVPDRDHLIAGTSLSIPE